MLVTMCDLRFASTDASFTTVFTKRGLIAEHGTTWILPRQAPPAAVPAPRLEPARLTAPPQMRYVRAAVSWYSACSSPALAPAEISRNASHNVA